MVDTLSLGVNLFFLISESKMSANTRTLPSPLLFYARSGSLLFKFIQVNHGNPVRITIEDVEQLIIKYCLKKMLRDVINLYVVWPELKTLEWDILNPDRIINLEIKFMRKTSHI